MEQSHAKEAHESGQGQKPDKSAQIQKQSTSCRTLKNEPSSTGRPKTRLSPPQQPRTAMLQHLQNCFNKVAEADIANFNITLFPVALSKNPHEGLDLGIKSFYQIKKKGPVGLEEIKKMMIAKGHEFGKGVREALEQLFSSPSYCQYLENSVSRTPEKQVIDVEDITKEPTISVKSTKSHQPKKGTNSTIRSAKTQRSDSRMNAPQPSQYQTDRVVDLTEKGVCLCDKGVKTTEDSFVCVHCGHLYHFDCMNRKQKTKHCLYCHLKKIIPNKEVKKTLFMGQLKKGRKRHEFTIHLTQQDIANRHKLQVRCFRIKDTTQNFILFPDFTDIVINNFIVKEFRPLHRQSSLKYRKDEAFYAQIKHLIPKENKVVINQKLPAKETKDSRIEAENHLIGFFIVEEKKTDILVQEILAQAVTLFQDSKTLLNSAFIQFSGSDGVSCEVVKIPLTCTLTTEKIKIPARGIFCTHYQCFDLTNYLMMTSQSANPRWVCPLCKQPCYQFNIDCILLSILQEYAEQPLTEVMFFKNGQFSIYTGQTDVKDVKIKNIHNLPIDTIAKRAVMQLAPDPEKRKKKVFEEPEASKVISLDLD